MVVIDHKNAPALLQQMKYVVFNDITARDIQGAEMKSGVFSRSKSIKSRQVSHTGRMSVTIPEIISHYSPMGYSPGDIVSTGTVSGVAGFSPDAASLYLKPGDVMECEIEGVGTLRNPVISWQEGHGEPAPPRVRW